jgi:hypothetical protein
VPFIKPLQNRGWVLSIITFPPSNYGIGTIGDDLKSPLSPLFLKGRTHYSLLRGYGNVLLFNPVISRISFWGFPAHLRNGHDSAFQIPFEIPAGFTFSKGRTFYHAAWECGDCL